MGCARSVRGAELAMGDARGGHRFGAVQFFGPPGAAEAGSVPRGPRECVRFRVVPANAGTHTHRPSFCEGYWLRLPTVRSRGMGPGVRRDDGVTASAAAAPRAC